MNTIQQKFEANCRQGNIEEIKNIINSNEFLEQQSLTYHYSSGIYQACDYNQLNIVKFLLEQSDFQKNIDINFENNCILKTACRQNYIEIINYLVLEYKMKFTNDLFMPNYENVNYVVDIYEKRLLNENLHRNLPEKKLKIKSHKI